jgi:hypothetical protein
MELIDRFAMAQRDDTTEVVVVNAPGGDVDLRCGGHPMVAVGVDTPAALAVESGCDEGTQLGKRYADDTVGIEVLCTKAGPGSLTLDVRSVAG